MALGAFEGLFNASLCIQTQHVHIAITTAAPKDAAAF